MTFTYQVEQLEHDDGTDLFIVKRASHTDGEDDDVIELEVVDDLMTLRATDLEAYEMIVTIASMFLARGPEFEAAEA